MLHLREVFDMYEGEGIVFGSTNQKTFKSLNQIKLEDEIIVYFETIVGTLDKKIEFNLE